jgi:hypothetical protein
MWYSQFVLGINCVGWYPAPSPPANCTDREIKLLTDLRSSWRQNMLPGFARNGNGAFVDTCVVHE